MTTLNRSAIFLAAFALLVGCQREEGAQMEMAGGRAEAMMMLPVTTTSESAREQFMLGQRAMDMGEFFEANDYFKQAVAADPNFAFGYLQVANTANSLDEFRTNLKNAADHAESASEAERILIQIAQRGFENDVEGQLTLARRLVEIQRSSPRAWLELANVQTSLGENVEARTSMTRATELAPQFAPAYMNLINSYLFAEPRDFAKAGEYAGTLGELVPQEPIAHDLQGDVYRAQGDLEAAREAYTRAAGLDLTDGLPLQQRGHVNSFLGNYDQARADYDAAMALGKANDRPSYAVWRALVSVHAGEAQAAIDELNTLVAQIDGMNVPEPTGLKINALTNAAIIALHTGNYESAEEALKRRTVLMMEEADRVATDAFRRGQLSNIALFDGWLAARKGDFETATAKAQEAMTHLEPDPNPRKNEPAHQLLGFISLQQGEAQEAIAHLEQGPPTNIYTTYYLALAHKAAGNDDQARELFSQVANYNFNNVFFALVRADAKKRAAET